MPMLMAMATPIFSLLDRWCFDDVFLVHLSKMGHGRIDNKMSTSPE